MVPLLRASHLQPTLAVTAIATTLALTAERGTGAASVGAAVLAGQLSVGWSNDFLDADRDRIAGRLDKPVPAGEVSRTVVGRAAVAAAAAAVPLSLLSGWRAGIVHIAAVTVAWLYNLRLKNSAASVLPYAVAFGSLPAFVTLGACGHPWPPAWATAAAALLGAGAHLVNSLFDLEEDARTGIRGAPHRLGASRSLMMGTALLAAATAVVSISPPGRPGRVALACIAMTCLALVGIPVAVLSGRPRAAWSLALGTAGLLVLVLVAQGRSLTPR